MVRMVSAAMRALCQGGKQSGPTAKRPRYGKVMRAGSALIFHNETWPTPGAAARVKGPHQENKCLNKT